MLAFVLLRLASSCSISASFEPPLFATLSSVTWTNTGTNGVGAGTIVLVPQSGDAGTTTLTAKVLDANGATIATAVVDVMVKDPMAATCRDWLDLYLNFPEEWYGLTGSIIYSRKNITSLTDAFGLDNRSQLQARVSVPVFGGLYGSVIARYSFDRDERGQLSTQAMYEPKVDYIFRW